MTSGTVSSFLILLLSCSPALAQQQSQQVQYNQVLNVNGDMQLNSFVFPDRSKIETFSQKQQQIIVNQQTPSISSNQVTGSTGQPFVPLVQQSMTISTNGATDLVGGQIEMAMTPQQLAAVQVNMDNTYVAKLSPDRQTWMIQETMRSVNATDMTVRMIRRQNLDGEYMVLGRQTTETEAVLTPFGNDGASSVAITGTGLQENEFQDGFRMSVKANQPMTMNVNVKKGIDSSMVAGLQGQQSVNDYRYSVTTNLAGVQPNLNQQVTVIQMPINAQRIQKMMQAAGVQPGGQVALSVAQRGVLSNPGGATANLGGAAAPQRRGREAFRQTISERQVQGQTGTNGGTPTNGNNPVATQLLLSPTFTPIQADVVLDTVNMRIAFPVSAVDGEYILTMQTSGAQAQAQPAPQGQTPQGQTPQGQTPQGQTPQGQTPQGQTPQGQTPQGQTPQGQTPQGQTPQGQTPQGQTPPSAAAPPAGEPAPPSAAPSAAPSEAPRPLTGTNSTTPAEPRPAGEATPAEPKPAGEATPPAEPKPAARSLLAARQSSTTSSETSPGKGSVYITMREVDRMVDSENWGGQAPISKMMSEFLKGVNGTESA